MTHLYYDPSNGWSEQNGTIDEALADLRREGGNITIEEDTHHTRFRTVTLWLVGEDGKGDECFFIEETIGQLRPQSP